MVVGSRSNQKVVSEVAANCLMVDQKKKFSAWSRSPFFSPCLLLNHLAGLSGCSNQYTGGVKIRDADSTKLWDSDFYNQLTTGSKDCMIPIITAAMLVWSLQRIGKI